jgi:hypothetical protein
MISRRTKEVLAAANGQRPGGNRGNLPVIGDKGRIASLATRKPRPRVEPPTWRLSSRNCGLPALPPSGRLRLG